MRHVNAKVCASSYSPAGMFEFFFVHIYGNVSAHEVLKPAGMIQVQVANNDGLDILDVVSSSLYSGWQFLCLAILNSREYVCERSSPVLENGFLVNLMIQLEVNKLTMSRSSAQPVS